MRTNAKIPLIGAVILLQAFAAVFFLNDVFWDVYLGPLGFHIDGHAAVEIMAAVVLAVAIVLEVRLLQALRAEGRRMARDLEIARGQLAKVIEGEFSRWRLSPAEREVAWLAIKGFPIAEIARIRGAREGTVKAQLNSLYRKAGVSGRTELVSGLVEGLLDGGVGDGPADAA
ncbi:MAG: LuxR family transcriptional regulator [Alphaproteobacteria bacterium]|nr:MAG: LuxR family transcriptional regulator [Alphaproteobacteria bacterium]